MDVHLDDEPIAKCASMAQNSASSATSLASSRFCAVLRRAVVHEDADALHHAGRAGAFEILAADRQPVG